MDVSPNSDPYSLSQEGFPLVRDLMQPKPWIYWLDYLSCTALGWAAFFAAGNVLWAPWARAACLVVAALSLYRSAIFIHEITHLRKGAVPWFRPIWNLLTGIPLLIPSFFYEGVHISHHRRDLYGTHGDGEYFPFARKARRFIPIFVLGNLLLPPLLYLRHLVLVPLSLMSRSIRSWTWAHFSSLEVNFSYVRPLPPSGVMSRDEILAFLFCVTCSAAFYRGVIPPHWIFIWYSMAAILLTTNAVRTLVAHRYRFAGESTVTPVEQYLDSIDVPGNFLTALWAPVGLRFHATHHLFPGLPYHSLGLAHRRLNAGLMKNSALYRKATCPSLGRAIRELWAAAGLNP